MQWSTFRDEFRATILNDTDSTRYKWSNANLLTYLRLSMNALCSHTAMATATSFVSDGETTTYSVPDNCFEDIDLTGAVYIDDGTTKTYLNPVKITQLQRVTTGYYLMPRNVVNLVDTPDVDDEIEIYYFSYYPTPTSDNDTLLFPAWAQAAISYRMGAYAMTKFATKYANINQWNTTASKGNPEDSSMGERAIFYFSQWESELAGQPAQRRENFFREI